jgi:hypothetical protein
VASNLRCLGLPIDDVDDWDRLLDVVLPAAFEIGTVFLAGSMNLPSTPSRRWPRRRPR